MNTIMQAWNSHCFACQFIFVTMLRFSLFLYSSNRKIDRLINVIFFHTDYLRFRIIHRSSAEVEWCADHLNMDSPAPPAVYFCTEITTVLLKLYH